MLRLLKFRNLEEGPEKLKLRRLRTGCASAHVASVTGVVQWGKTPPPAPGGGICYLVLLSLKEYNKAIFVNVGKSSKNPGLLQEGSVSTKVNKGGWGDAHRLETASLK